MSSSVLRFFGCYPVPDDHKKTFGKVSSRRQCTNFVWLFLFLTFLTGLLFLGFYASRVGDILRLFHVTDSFGNRCGLQNIVVNVTAARGPDIPFPQSGMDFRNRPFALPLDVGRNKDYAWICVEHCPRNSFYSPKALAEHVLRWHDMSLCSSNFAALFTMNETRPHDSMSTLRNFTNVGPCARPPIYKSRSLSNRCVPTRVADLKSDAIVRLKSYIDEDFVRQLFVDFYAGRYVFIAVVVVSLASSLYITYQMIYDNARIVYIFYVTTMPCGIVCSVVLLCTFLYNIIGSFFLESAYLSLPSSYERFINGFRVERTLLFVLLLIVALFTLVSWTLTWTIFTPRRALVSELFFQARKPLKCMLWLVVETVFNCLFSLALFVLWIYVLLNILSAEVPQWYTITKRMSDTVMKNMRDEIHEPVVSAIRLVHPWWTRFALAYHVWALLWIKSFLSDAQKIFVAQATSTWYFGENRKSQWRYVFFRSLFILICYHLGTVAFGSMLLLLIRIPSHVFLFIYYRIGKSKRPSVVDFHNRNFIWLSNFERTLRYIHSNAYAIVATNGEDFLAACKTATNLWMDNSWYLLTTNTVAALLFTMTNLTFSLTVALFSGFYFRWLADVEYWLWPTLLCALLAHFILNRFLALHQMIIETMFLCYASEIDGYDSRAQFNGLPRKADYGFNYYMARRIYEERRLNSSLGFSLSAISDPSQADGLNRASSTNATPVTVYMSHGDELGRNDHEQTLNNNPRDQIVQIYRNMTSTPL